MKDPEKTGIIFPILNNLTPTIESCTMKLIEELGELMQLIGKGQGKSGETLKKKTDRWAIDTISEALDVAQSAITMFHTLSKEYGINSDIMMEIHEEKLKERGYLK